MYSNASAFQVRRLLLLSFHFILYKLWRRRWRWRWRRIVVTNACRKPKIWHFYYFRLIRTPSSHTNKLKRKTKLTSKCAGPIFHSTFSVLFLHPSDDSWVNARAYGLHLWRNYSATHIDTSTWQLRYVIECIEFISNVRAKVRIQYFQSIVLLTRRQRRDEM